MATSKKTVTKKAKKQPLKRSTVKKSVASRTNESDFWKVQFSLNTVYWIIIGLAVVSTAMLAYNNNQRINEIYDSIDQTNVISDDLPDYETTKPTDTTKPAEPTY